MSTISAPLTDSRIMLRRNLKHIRRNPTTIFNGALMPVVLMLLLVYVFGNAFNVGEHYVEYATPGLILLAITYGLSGTAVSVSSDMTKGIINRFKVMNVSRVAVLNGHVVATMLISSVGIAVIIGMAFALGFRSPASPLDWLGAIGIALAAAFAAAWLTVALGMAAKTPESAGLSVDLRSDLYSLGVTLWTMLAGKPPFRGTGPNQKYQICALPEIYCWLCWPRCCCPIC